MRFFIWALVLGVVAGYSQSSKTSHVPQQSLTSEKVTENTAEPIILRIRTETPKNELLGSTVTATPSFSTTAALSSTFALQKITESSPKPEPLTNIPHKEEEEASAVSPTIEEDIPSQSPISYPLEELNKRRTVTYDQRQEGQYNIRADLENFMIVLIPPSPADGLNLLDLLTKSAIRPNKNKRKQYANSAGHNNAFKYRQNLKSAHTNFNLNYLPRSQSLSHPPHLTLVEGVTAQRLPSEFIDGRTPYHVDISASDDEQSRLHADSQVDVLPPPYSLAYQHLIKPFHLESEPTVIQTLPPAEGSQNVAQSTGNLFESYNQLLANKGNKDGVLGESTLNSPGFYRMSRNIRNDNYLDTNRLVASSSLNRAVEMPFYRADMSFGASSLYPPIDVPRFMGYDMRSKLARSDNDGQQLDDIMFVPSIKDSLELESGLLDTKGKALLSDDKGLLMERCAPGRRRDSYGICREIEGY